MRKTRLLGLLGMTGLIAMACQSVGTSSPPGASPSAASSSEPTLSPEPTPVLTLTPTIPPLVDNDNPPGIAITALPFEDRRDTTRAQIHAMEPAGPCDAGGQSVWYAFEATASGRLVASTAGSDYDTVLDVWRGALSTNLQDPGFELLEPIACNDDMGDGSSQAGIVFDAEAGTSYVFRASTALDASGGELVFSLTSQ